MHTLADLAGCVMHWTIGRIVRGHCRCHLCSDHTSDGPSRWKQEHQAIDERIGWTDKEIPIWRICQM